MSYLSFFRFSPNKFLVAIVAGLLVVSYLLYMVDVWATERIDGLLLAHYGPELYERYTSALQEVRTEKVSKIWALENLQDPLDLEPEPQWTAEDEVRRSQIIFGEVFTFVYSIWFLSWQICLLSISVIYLTTVKITFLKLVNTLPTKVIKAYLIAEEQQYRGQFLPSRRSVLCLLNLALAQLHIFVCLHHQFVQGLTPTANTAVRANSVLCPDSAKRCGCDSVTYNITTLFDLCSSHIPWS